MKPSDVAEMSREEFADMLEMASGYYDYLVGDNPQRSYVHGVDLEVWFKQAAARLRNSIPKPVVEDHVRDYGGEYVTINGHEVCSFGLEEWWNDAYEIAESIKTALGINDTEGGE